MTIFYSLTKSNFTNGATHYRAVVHSTKTIYLPQVIERMVANGCAVSGNDANGVIDHFFDAVGEYLIDGCRVVTRGGNFSMSIKGNFDGKTDSFSTDRHRVNVNINAGALFRRNVLSRVRIQKELSGPVRPQADSDTLSDLPPPDLRPGPG